MIPAIIRILVRLLLRLRYRVRVSGLAPIAARGRTGILFLPNHPALIDPVILLAELHRDFAPRTLADQDQVNRPVIRSLAPRFGVRTMPDPLKHGDACRPQVEQVIRDCIEGLRRGENLLLYPAGRIYRQRLEDLAGNSAVETILRETPGIRVVLVRTRGLWGSGFSFAAGRPPAVGQVLLKGVFRLLASGIFFAPRRAVSIEFGEPGNFAPAANRETLNRLLEAFYNEDAPPNTWVPYTIWERGGARVLPEPTTGRSREDLSDVPAATRELVIKHLRELTGKADLHENALLSRDLGLDSLAVVDLALWLESEFGYALGDNAALDTVGDVLLAACGITAPTGPTELKPVHRSWFVNGPAGRRMVIPEGGTVAEVFLRQARRAPGRRIVADQISGAKSYRSIIASILALKPRIERLSGEYVGIMLPASVGAATVYLATLFAGKTPVMVNWTVGLRNMSHSLDGLGVRHVLTSSRLIEKLKSQLGDIATIESRCLMLEDLGRQTPAWRKLAALARSVLSWRSLRAAKVAGPAVVLFTSGSESFPKAVPLTHANLLANMRDIEKVFSFREDDRLLGMLPPFHSFGINCTLLLPLCLGIPVVYHPNPTEGGILAATIEAYRVTLLVGTPTFLNGIIRSAARPQLASLRAVITGAEKCPAETREVVQRRWPRLVMLEGYGITECSPVVSLNRESDPRPGTIGRVLPSLRYTLRDPETGAAAAPGRPGMLLLRGPGIFAGYLNYQGPSPFVEAEGESWYRTGDLVSQDADGVLTFAGRLKRFVKLGGEMISLPAIEEVLAQHYGAPGDEKPILAVEALPEPLNPELVLFTVRDIAREEANQKIREAGLSPLHNIRRVVRLSEIPVLGTGKVDYRSLRERLKEV